MNITNSEKAATYADFFMNPKAGRRRIGLGQTSTLDEVILGRDADGSGGDPHVEFMRQFGDHAGVKSGVEQVRRRKVGCSMASAMDDTIWGRDFDKSGGDPEERFFEMYGSGFAGVRSGSVEKTTTRRPGYAMGSVMDSIIFGRDFDQSGEDPQVVWEQKFGGHAGGKTCPSEAALRPMKRRLLGSDCMSQMDDVLHGRVSDSLPRDPLNDLYSGMAGSRAGVERPQRPFRKPGFSNVSTFDHTKWGVKESDIPIHQQFFAQLFHDHAGIKTVRETKSQRNARLKVEQMRSMSVPPERMSRRSSKCSSSTSAPSSSSNCSSEADPVADVAAQQPVLASDKLEQEFRPPSRRSSSAHPRAQTPRRSSVSSVASSAAAAANKAALAAAAAAGAQAPPSSVASVGGQKSARSATPRASTPRRVLMPSAAEFVAARSHRTSSAGSLTSRDYGAFYPQEPQQQQQQQQQQQKVVKEDEQQPGSGSAVPWLDLGAQRNASFTGSCRTPGTPRKQKQEASLRCSNASAASTPRAATAAAPTAAPERTQTPVPGKRLGSSDLAAFAFKKGPSSECGSVASTAAGKSQVE